MKTGEIRTTKGALSGSPGSGLPRVGERGFTLIEILIALMIAAVVAGAIYSIYTNFFKQTAARDLITEAQQNARIGVGMMERELMNAGYAAGTADIITEATGSTIEFIYTDPETNALISATAGKRLKVKYALQTVGGVQYLTRKADNLTDATIGTTEMVVPYAQSLTFTYYDINGGALGTPFASQADRNNIRFITVNFVTQTKSDVPGTMQRKTFMVETHIRLRNIGVGTTATDTTPPATVANIKVRDPGKCGRLKVKWDMNTEGDIAGYKVYYGTSTGSYTGVINIPVTVLSSAAYSCTMVSSTYECTIFPSNPSLQFTASNAAAGTETVYYLALKSYDNSLNHSNYSTEASGNPTPSNSSFASGTDDSTLNPVKPQAVTGLTGANGPSDGQVALSWTAYDTSANPDVIGFRVYRSTSPFSSYPVNPSAPGVNWIAGEVGSGKPEVAASATTYTDPGPGLVGCTVYYYAIAPVNCDATLITDEGGDPNEKKYVQTDYGATCGDGSTSCTPGSGFAASSTSDTAPTNTTPPKAPSFNARAGWKRVALSFTQPNTDANNVPSTDISFTCLYSNTGVSFPTLNGTKDAIGCYNVTSGIRLYENNGKFTTADVPIGQSKTLWHNSMTQLTSTPDLAETGTYSYTAVTFNLCGTGSNPMQAQATTTLCQEDPPACPSVDPDGYCQAAPAKPPKVTVLTNSACGGNPDSVTLAWTGVSSDIGQKSRELNPYDLAGYRVFRSTSSADWSASTLLNTAAPYWGTGSVTFSDATATDGGTYYYRVVTTDCPYEKNSPLEATIRGDMISNYLKYEQTGPVKPGRLSRDEKCTGAGSCTKDDHREVLTGVNLDATNLPTPDSNYTHDKVTLFFENTSASMMTIQALSLAWVNSSAKLREVKVGGGRSGVGVTSNIIDPSLTGVLTGNPPYTSAVTNVALTIPAISASTRYIPITFEFKDASGNRVDMREDQLLITLSVRNDSTGTTSCVTYMTVSGSVAGITVPLGPTAVATQQNRPASPTFGFAVPGPTQLNTVPSGSNGPIVVDASTVVTVSTSAISNTTHAVTGTKVPITSVTLYYTDTANTVTTAPAAGFSSVAMTNTGGNIWSGNIPARDGRRVWYYVVAIDEDGNFDRDPEIADGAYVYDQKVFNVCDVTPSAPTGLIAVAGGSGPASYTVTLTWTAPTTYTTGGTIPGTDTIKYTVFRSGVQIATNISATTYTDTGLAAGVYSYTVRAYNSCATPGPKISADSTVAAQCAGISGQATLSVTPSNIRRGQSFTVTVVDCLAVNAGYASLVDVINLSSPPAPTAAFTNCPTTAYATFPTCFTTRSTAPATGSINPYSPTITETGAATAEFPKTVTTTGTTTDTDKLLTLESDTITAYYYYATPQTATVSVTPDPCGKTLSAPSWTGGFPNLSGSGANRVANLSWSAVTTYTDGNTVGAGDLAGYKVYMKVCPETIAGECTSAQAVYDGVAAVTTGTTATINQLDNSTNKWANRKYFLKVVAYKTCATTESAPTTTWEDTDL